MSGAQFGAATSGATQQTTVQLAIAAFQTTASCVIMNFTSDAKLPTVNPCSPVRNLK